MIVGGGSIGLLLPGEAAEEDDKVPATRALHGRTVATGQQWTLRPLFPSTVMLSLTRSHGPAPSVPLGYLRRSSPAVLVTARVGRRTFLRVRGYALALPLTGG